MDPTQDQVRQRLHYDPETGLFTRIAAGSACHAGRVGRLAGTRNRATGYVQFHACGGLHYAHRLAWIYVHGPIPDGARIDHANRLRDDNRLSNLRLATHADNMRNSKVRTDNTSGIKGVYFDAARGMWAAEIAGRKLGRFASREDAAAARREAARSAYGAFAAE